MQTTRLNKLFLLKRSLVLSVSADPTNRCLFFFLAISQNPAYLGDMHWCVRKDSGFIELKQLNFVTYRISSRRFRL